jgi:hypothetical protein
VRCCFLLCPPFDRYRARFAGPRAAGELCSVVPPRAWPCSLGVVNVSIG